MRAPLRGRPGLTKAQRTVLDCAFKWMSTDLDSMSVVLINGALEIPDWTGIRGKLDALAGKNHRPRGGVHDRVHRHGQHPQA